MSRTPHGMNLMRHGEPVRFNRLAWKSEKTLIP